MRKIYFTVCDGSDEPSLMSVTIEDLNTLPEDFEEFINSSINELLFQSNGTSETIVKSKGYTTESLAEYLRHKTGWDISIHEGINIEYEFSLF